MTVPLTDDQRDRLARALLMGRRHTFDEVAAMLAEARAEGAAEALLQVARDIQAAKPPHVTRNYTPIDMAYDDAARIARAALADPEADRPRPDDHEPPTWVMGMDL